MFTRTAKWRQLSAMLTSSRCFLGIMKMCSLPVCRLCGVAPALCLAWPGPVRLTPSDPRHYQIAESPALVLTESRIARRCHAIRRDSTNPGGGMPSRACRPITGVRLIGSQANAHAGGAPNARPGRARPRREARASPPTRAPTCGRSAPRA